MEDHTTIKLTIPRQDYTGLPLFQPEKEAAGNWVQSLPVTNTNSLVQLLGQALSDLNRTPLAPDKRFMIMEILRPSLEIALTNLSKRFLNQPLVMPKDLQHMAELSDRLLTMTATAYTIVAVEAIQQRDAIRDTNPARLTCEAIHRALIFASQKVLQNFQLHRPMEIHGWQTLHQLYVLAARQRLAELPVPEPLSGGNTITATYLQAMMMACSKPNQLRQSDLIALFRSLAQWSSLVRLEAHGSRSDLFLVDLESDQPPLYSALYREQPGDACRYLNTTALMEHLQNLREELVDKGASFDKSTGVPLTLADHLIASLGSMSLRNFKRTAASNPLWICVGLSSTHYHVAGQKLFEELLYSGEEILSNSAQSSGNPFLNARKKGDVWQKANPGEDYSSDVRFDPDQPINIDPTSRAKVLPEDNAALTPSERFPIFRVRMADASPSGYCLEWRGEMRTDIRIGDIVGLKEEEQNEWVIAVIRWLSRLDSAKTLVGLELLSPRAVACGARINQIGGDETPPMRVLVLPEIKLVGQPQTLLTPRTGFKERQKLTIGNSSQTASIQLLRHIGSTGSFSQFEFRYIKELGDVLAESQNGLASGEYDSIWSSI